MPLHVVDVNRLKFGQLFAHVLTNSWLTSYNVIGSSISPRAQAREFLR